MSVVPPYNKPSEFVGRQEIVLLHVRSFSTIDAVLERRLKRLEMKCYRRSRNLPCGTTTRQI